jgi:hypothetical protein
MGRGISNTVSLNRISREHRTPYTTEHRGASHVSITKNVKPRLAVTVVLAKLRRQRITSD